MSRRRHGHSSLRVFPSCSAKLELLSSHAVLFVWPSSRFEAIFSSSRSSSCEGRFRVRPAGIIHFCPPVTGTPWEHIAVDIASQFRCLGPSLDSHLLGRSSPSGSNSYSGCHLKPRMPRLSPLSFLFNLNLRYGWRSHEGDVPARLPCRTASCSAGISSGLTRVSCDFQVEPEREKQTQYGPDELNPSGRVCHTLPYANTTSAMSLGILCSKWRCVCFFQSPLSASIKKETFLFSPEFI